MSICVTIKIHSTISKLKKIRLRLLLKVRKFGISRSSRRRAFHNLGAATCKDLSLSVTLVLNVDDASKIPADHLRFYVPCDFKETKFWMYVGAIPWIALNAKNKILKWMRCFSESQCSWYISGIKWLMRGAQQTSLAAVFQTRWTLLSFSSRNAIDRNGCEGDNDSLLF